MQFTRDNLSKRVVVLREQNHLDKVCKDLGVNVNDLTINKFPMIVYEGQYKSIDILEIEDDNIKQLKQESLEYRTVWEFESVLNGTADFMEKFE